MMTKTFVILTLAPAPRNLYQEVRRSLFKRLVSAIDKR